MRSCSCAFWTATASCEASAVEKRGLALAHRAAALGIDREQADHVVAHEERDRERRVDACLVRGAAHVHEPEIGDGVRHFDERPASPGRADAELEQPLGDSRVRSAEAGTGRRDKPVFGDTQVDGDALDVEQLCDARDRRLERVRERELGRRLPDDHEQRPRELELLLELPDPRARAKDVGGANTERREPSELVRARLSARREQELQEADGRLAEPQRRRHAAAARQPVERERANGSARLRAQRPAASAASPRSTVGSRPYEPTSSSASSSARCQSSATGAPTTPAASRTTSAAGVGLVQRGGERVACEIERMARDAGIGRRPGRERAQDERDLTGSELGGKLTRRRERPCAIELQHGGRPVEAHRQHEDRSCPGARGDALDAP